MAIYQFVIVIMSFFKSALSAVSVVTAQIPHCAVYSAEIRETAQSAVLQKKND
jgi:hypothetical protein